MTDDRPPLFRCAHCDSPIRTLHGLIVCQGSTFCKDSCHYAAHTHDRERS